MIAGSWTCLGIALLLSFALGRFVRRSRVRLALLGLVLALPWLVAAASLDWSARDEDAGWVFAIFAMISIVEFGHAGLALLAYLAGRAFAAEA